MNEAQPIVYEDMDRPNGIARTDAPLPGWFDSSMGRITQAIMQVISHDQHEYLEHKRLPHAIKTSEALVKPHLLEDGKVILTTVFPVASEQSFIVYFTPIYDGGHDMWGTAPLTDEIGVLGFNVMVFKENGHYAVNNTPIKPGSAIVDELCRQAKAMKLRHPQFLYFTILTPRAAEGFEDPNNHLAKLIDRTNHVAQAKVAAQTSAQPTPLDD